MKDFFKKYGVLTLITCFLVGIIGYYAYETNKDKIPGKKVNGEDVVYSVNGIDVTADQLYEKMYQSGGTTALAMMFENAVLDQAVETTDDMKTLADQNYDSIVYNYQNNYGNDYEAYLLSALNSLGYSKLEDLKTYLINQSKVTKLADEYLTNHPEVFEEYAAENHPHILSHILVKMEDPENPTDEEKAKMASVDAALAEGKSFGEVAAEFSDDTSAANQGSLGMSDDNTSYVPEFLEAASKLKAGETSEWTKTDYGYHLIHCDADDYDTLKADGTLLSTMLTTITDFRAKVLMEKAEELGIDFKDNAELETALKKYMGLEEGK
ncbi:MAG: peptidylprolyl isomerase [Erysipelotrichaceae bacterium]|nr:peptidylprolyl isomerase [Erysipelotrichaceae bacterium]